MDLNLKVLCVMFRCYSVGIIFSLNVARCSMLVVLVYHVIIRAALFCVFCTRLFVGAQLGLA